MLEPRRIKIISRFLVQDYLHAHRIASLVAVFPSPKAYTLKLRLKDSHFPPSRGIGLNVAEIELGVLNRQCRRHGFPTVIARKPYREYPNR